MAIFEIIEKLEGENNVTATLSEFILQEIINQKDYSMWIFVVFMLPMDIEYSLQV